MATYKVNVKWSKEKYSDIDLDTSEPTVVFKAQLMALTGVEPDRQKIILKGKTLKDSWEEIKGLKDGVTIQLMGSATALPEVPPEKTVFEEDLTEQQLAIHKKVPVGLKNLGNTCYMNATVQCLRTIPELREALTSFSSRSLGGASAIGESGSITKGFQELFSELEDSSEPVVPMTFLQSMFAALPQFYERAEQGGFVQQDANECWIQLVRFLQQGLIRSGKSKSFIDEFMRIDFSRTLKCVETEEEPAVTTKGEPAYQLGCYIDNNVKHMMTGLINGMKGTINKRSPVLDRDADYETSSSISRLPAYISVQFVRFQYKKNQAVNAKILKDIKFTPALDLYELCTPELQKRLIPMREEIKAEDDRQEETIKEAKLKGEPLKKEKKTVKKPYSFADDEGSNNSGHYVLQAVLTHKGRSSSSGHYVAWVRSTGDDWLMFDDEHVTPVKMENIKELSGGGDWHTAYVLLYGPRILEIDATSDISAVSDATSTSEPMQ